MISLDPGLPLNIPCLTPFRILLFFSSFFYVPQWKKRTVYNKLNTTIRFFVLSLETKFSISGSLSELDRPNTKRRKISIKQESMAHSPPLPSPPDLKISDYADNNKYSKLIHDHHNNNSNNIPLTPPPNTCNNYHNISTTTPTTAPTIISSSSSSSLALWALLFCKRGRSGKPHFQKSVGG